MSRKECDILRFEPRGEKFSLVRIEADGTRSELMLTAANVVHLGMLASDFSHRLLANKVAKKSGWLGATIKSRMVNTNVRAIEMLVRVLEKRSRGPDPIITEQRARRLASNLLAKADKLATLPEHGTSEPPSKSADERP